MAVIGSTLRILELLTIRQNRRFGAFVRSVSPVFPIALEARNGTLVREDHFAKKSPFRRKLPCGNIATVHKSRLY